MKEAFYVYNNEAIASCVLLSVIDQLGEIDISRCCLVLPFLLDDRTTKYVLKNFDDNVNLLDFVSSQPAIFASFNKRYLSLFPVMINSLMILKKTNQIGISNLIESKRDLKFLSSKMGERFSEIEECIPVFLKLILNYPTEQLYTIFRIQL